MHVRRSRRWAAWCLIACLGALAPHVSAAASEPPAEPRARPGPTLLIPAHPDSAPPESEPAPLLIPGRPSPGDSTVFDRARRVREAVAMGRQLEANGAPGAAIVSYLNALKLDPKIAGVHYQIAMLFLTRDQVGEAAKHLAAEVEHHPDNTDAIRQLGLCLARLGESQRAIRHLERLTRRRPKDGANWSALGYAYLTANRAREAEAALRRALRLPPTTVEEHRDLGAALGAMGRDREARLEYLRALAIAPRDGSTWLNLGNLERRAGHADSALACYRRAEAGDSSLALALEAQARLLHEMKRDGEAVEAYRRWIARHPDHHGARLEAVRLLDELGRTDEALAVARAGTRQDVDTAQPHVILAMVLRGRGDLRGALAELRRAETLFRTSPGDQERVRKTIAAMRAAAPDSLRALFAADSAASLAPNKHHP